MLSVSWGQPEEERRREEDALSVARKVSPERHRLTLPARDESRCDTVGDKREKGDDLSAVNSGSGAADDAAAKDTLTHSG